MSDDDAKTLWCGNLSEHVTEELLYELFLQAGPLEKVRIPREKDGRQKTFAFVTFGHELSVPYAIELFKGTALFNRTLTIQCRTVNNRFQDNQNDHNRGNRQNGQDNYAMRHDNYDRNSQRNNDNSYKRPRNDDYESRRNEPNHRYGSSHERRMKKRSRRYD